MACRLIVNLCLMSFQLVGCCFALDISYYLSCETLTKGMVERNGGRRGKTIKERHRTKQNNTGEDRTIEDRLRVWAEKRLQGR